MRIDVIAYDHPDAVSLIAEVQQEYVVLYGGPDATPVDPADFAPPKGLFLVGYHEGEPAVCAGWRVYGEDAAELKRMYVRPGVRGHGLARAILVELERTVASAGRRRVVLETGDRQPAAIALYRSAGYDDIPKFGHYADEQGSVHLGKWLSSPVGSTVKEPVCPSTP